MRLARCCGLLLAASTLAMAAPAFETRRFTAALRTRGALGARVLTHARVPSTQALAAELAQAEGARAHGAIVLAEEQSAGIGRRGRRWDGGDSGDALLFSMVWAPAPPEGCAATNATTLLPELVRLNLAAAVAVARACTAVGMAGARVKWPNDVWAGVPPRKLAGVILDYGGADSAVLGVGINVLQPMVGDAAATSVATELGGSGAAAVEGGGLRERVLAAFCDELDALMALDTAGVIAEHAAIHLLDGRRVRVHHRTREENDPRDYDADVLGVAAYGQLRVRRAVGAPEVLLSGEEVSITPQLW